MVSRQAAANCFPYFLPGNGAIKFSPASVSTESKGSPELRRRRPFEIGPEVGRQVSDETVDDCRTGGISSAFVCRRGFCERGT